MAFAIQGRNPFVPESRIYPIIEMESTFDYDS